MRGDAAVVRPTPTWNRIFSGLVVLVLLPATARAEVLTDSRVIRLARARDATVLAARQAVAVAGAREVEAGLYPNPVLGWDREHLPVAGSDDVSEDTLSVSVPVDVSGRRPARRALARSEVAAERAKAASSERAAVARALTLFYTALGAERRVDIARRTLERFDEAARILARRHEQGTASGYEQSRFEIEAELARSALREARGRAAALADELALLLGLEPGRIELRGALSPVPDDLATEPIAARALGRASLELARASLAEARAARDSASWAWLPTVSLTGGLRVATAGDTRYGYVAGAALDIPLFSRGQHLRAEAASTERLRAARVRAKERAVRIEATRAERELGLAMRELVRFEGATVEHLERLQRAAESGYREGERTILELLDAQRAWAAVESRKLELALQVKRAEVALRAARGEFE